MADPMACAECRGWWAQRRAGIVEMVDQELALDNLTAEAYKMLGVHRPAAGLTRGEVIQHLLGVYHNAGHVWEDPDVDGKEDQ